MHIKHNDPCAGLFLEPPPRSLQKIDGIIGEVTPSLPVSLRVHVLADKEVRMLSSREQRKGDPCERRERDQIVI